MVPGYSACLSEPVSRRPTDRTKSPAGLRFRKGDVDLVPHEDDLAYASHIDETPATVRHPLVSVARPTTKLRNWFRSLTIRIYTGFNGL